MKFDKSKVYTALNADELKEGDKVLLADNLEELKKQVKDYESPTMLAEIAPECEHFRFKNPNDLWYALAYLVFSPPKLEYKPFSDSNTALQIISKHGGWVKGDDTYYLVTGVNLVKEVEIRIRDYWISATYALENFTFADDDSPVGVKVDDTRAARLNLNL